MASHLIILISFLSYIDISLQQNDPGTVTCYSWTGQPFKNNIICPGSNICCASADLCDPNRFCQANNQTIVPSCAVFPWNNCANICQYDPGTGFLPRALKCNDGSYCCDNEPKCCADNEGIVLDGLGAIVSTDGGLAALTMSTTSSSSRGTSATTTAISTSSRSNSATATAASTQAPIVNATNTPSISASSTSTLSVGAIVGIAVGVLIVGGVIGALLFYIFRRRRARGTLAARDGYALADSQKRRDEQHIPGHSKPGELGYNPRGQHNSVFHARQKSFDKQPQEMSVNTL